MADDKNKDAEFYKETIIGSNRRASKFYETNNDKRTSRELVAYFKQPTRKAPKFNQNDINGGVLDWLNATPAKRSRDGILRVDRKPIWSDLSSPHTMSPYYRGSVNTQEQIELMQSFARQSNRGRGSYHALDIETIGDVDAGNFHISEIAIQGFTQKKNGFAANSRETFSRILKPRDSFASQTRKAINGMINSPERFAKLNAIQQLSLINLVRYSTMQGGNYTAAQFATTGRNTEVVHNTLVNAMMNGKSINTSEVVSNFRTYAPHMISGLDAMGQYGQDIDSTMAEYNAFVNKRSKSFFLTQNGAAFDLPALQKFGGTAPMRKHIDFLHLVQSVYHDTVSMHSRFNPNRPKNFEQGTLSLHEWRRTLGIATDKSHAGTYDVGEGGLGGIFNQTWRTIDQDMAAGFGASVDGQSTRGAGLRWSDSPLRKGQTFFSSRAVRKTAGFNDFQAERNGKKFVPYSPGGSSNVLDAETFYEVGSIRKSSHEGNLRVALELINRENQTSSFIIREGDKAREQIAEFMQRSGIIWDTASTSDKAAILSSGAEDRARRRYHRMFSLEQRRTSGFMAAQRMYGNARAWDEGRSADLDFNSLWDPKTKTFKHNMHEERDFYQMLPRLQSERPIFEQALSSIASNLPLTGSKARDKDINIQRSMALQNFASGVDGVAGLHTSTRNRFDFESRSFSFTDRVSGRDRSLNLSSLETASSDVMRYIYQDKTRLDGKPEALDRAVRERLKIFITSTQEAGLVSSEDAGVMMNRYFSEYSGLSPAVVAKSLAADIMTNMEANPAQLQIERVSTPRTGMGRINADVARSLIDNATQMGSMRRAKIHGSGNGQFVNLENELLGGILRQKDRVQGVTGISPNNMGAMSNLIDNVINNKHSRYLDYAVSMNKENSIGYVHVFNRDDSLSAIEQINKGGTPTNALTLAMPLVNENGTLVYGNQSINARMDLIHMEGEGNRLVSSSERISMVYTQRQNLNSMLQSVLNRDFQKSQSFGDRVLREQLQRLAGVTRNVMAGSSDSFMVAGNLSDAMRQSQINVSSAMIHDYITNGMLTETGKGSHIRNGAEIRRRGDNKLTNFLEMDMLTPEGQDIIRRNMPAWASENLRDLYVSGVKGDKFTEGAMSTINGADIYAYGQFTNQGRDNAIQAMNADLISPELQDKIGGLRGSGLYVNFDPMATTAKMEQLKDAYMPQTGGRSYASGMHIKAAYMSNSQLDERMSAMLADPSMQGILREENIISANGGVNIERMPKVYEQQALVNKGLMDMLEFSRQKSIDLTEHINNSFQFAAELVDENGSLRSGMRIGAGDRIGTVVANGMIKDVFHQMGSDITTMNFDAARGRMNVSQMERTHKGFLDIEKFTVGGGGGYGQRFLEALTGVKGVGAVYNPNISKHEDFGGAIRGQVNKAIDLAGNDPARIAALEAAGIGVSYQNGRFIADSSMKNIDGSKVTSLLNSFGGSESVATTINGQSFSTTYAIQEFRAANVSNYGRAVDGDGVKGVRYGLREMDILERRGLKNTYSAVYDQMMKGSDRTGAYNEALGMIDSLRSFVPGETVDAMSFNVDDFEHMPEIDGNVNTYRNTILDAEGMRKILPKGATGFFLNLPDVESEMVLRGQKIGDRKQISQVYIPLLDLHGEGNDVYKTLMQRQIADIHRRAAEVQRLNASGAVEARLAMPSAFAAMSQSVNSFADELNTQLTSSRGLLFGKTLKAEMPNSASGLVKIIPPSVASRLDGEYTFMSQNDARRMLGNDDLYDRVRAGQDYYLTNLRHPSFHTDAMITSKLQISDHVLDGEHLVTPGLAEAYRGDSDGDYQHMVSFAGEEESRRVAIQAELARDHRKLGVKFDGDLDTSYSLEGLGGAFTANDPNSAGDITAKSGKALVGMASDLNFKWRQIAKEYLPESDPGRLAIERFGSGLEQKIISAKHDKSGTLTTNPALSFVQALQRNDWDKALDIDRGSDLLGGGKSFISEYDMGAAMNAMRTISERHPSLGMGTGAGMRGATDRQVMGALANVDEGVIQSNPAASLVHQMLGVDREYGMQRDIPVSSRSAEYNSSIPAEEYIDPKVWHQAKASDITRQRSAIERTISEAWTAVNNSPTAKIVGVAALALGGMFAAFNSLDPIRAMPENKPQNRQEFQQPAPPPQGTAPGPTARIEENGRGLSVNIKGRGQGNVDNHHIAGLVDQGLQSSGIPTQVNIQSKDDSSRIDQGWMQDRVSQLLTDGYVN